MTTSGKTAEQTGKNRAIALRYATEGWGTEPYWQKIWDELLALNVTQHFASQPQPIVGLEANKQFNAELFAGFPNIAQTINDVVAEGDKVAYVATLAGTHMGTFMGIPPTGKSIEVSESFNLLRIDNGKIVEIWYQLNLLKVMQDIGGV